MNKQEYRIKIRKSEKDEWKYVSGYSEHALGVTWQTTKDKYSAMRETNPDYLCSIGGNKFFFEWEKW